MTFYQSSEGERIRSMTMTYSNLFSFKVEAVFLLCVCPGLRLLQIAEHGRVEL